LVACMPRMHVRRGRSPVGDVRLSGTFACRGHSPVGDVRLPVVAKRTADFSSSFLNSRPFSASSTSSSAPFPLYLSSFMSQRVPRRGRTNEVVKQRKRTPQEVDERINILRKNFKVVRDTVTLLENTLFSGDLPRYIVNHWSPYDPFPSTEEWNRSRRECKCPNRCNEYDTCLRWFSKVRSSLYVSLFLLSAV
jgi:hypothetical protein